MFDINVFVHADSDERLIRRLKRDMADRGRDLNEVLDRYQNTLKPMHQQFIEPTKEFADIIIPTNKHNTVAVNLIRSIINQKLAEHNLKFSEIKQKKWIRIISNKYLLILILLSHLDVFFRHKLLLHSQRIKPRH